MYVHVLASFNFLTPVFNYMKHFMLYVYKIGFQVKSSFQVFPANIDLLHSDQDTFAKNELI